MRFKINSNSISLVITFGLFISTLPSRSQVVFENPRNPVYKYLSRQAQKGNIQYDDLVKPLSRKTISQKLLFLRDSVTGLSNTEQKELEFYLADFSEFRDDLSDHTLFLKKDQYGRRRFLSVANNNLILRGDPALTLESHFGSGKSVLKRGTGLDFYGYLGKRIGFQASFQDITEAGNGVDSLKQFSSETGIVRTAFVNSSSGKPNFNYSEIKGHMTYSWDEGLISFGKDHLLWGYGENGQPVLSDKAPSYPYIRFEYQLLKWLKFNYSHSWLQSGLIDSSRSYNKGNSLYGNVREVYISKFMAMHSLTVIPVKGLTLSLGESMVYSDNFDPAYLIPVLFFKAYDQYSSRYKITTGSNAQFFFQANSRNHLPNTHLYTTLFIDEVRTSEIFNPAKSRNQLGFNIGGSVTDLFIPYLTLGAEYVRINPFVYQNLVPAQNYTNQNYLVGEWIGQNADRLSGWLSYNPVSRLTIRMQVDNIRKGKDGTLPDQYFAVPQPAFLSRGPVEQQTQLLTEIRYELINKLYLKGSYFYQKGVIRPSIQTSAIPHEFRFGFNYGF